MSVTPYLAPTYFASTYFAPTYYSGALYLAPVPGVISVSSGGGIDTVTYAAPTAGSAAVASASLYVGPSPGGESATPVAIHYGASNGFFSYDSAAPGSTNYYVIRFTDTGGIISAPSNEVLHVTPAVSGVVSTPLAGGYPGAQLPAPPVPTSAVGSPQAFWSYFQASGNYIVAVIGGLIVVEPTGLVSGDNVVRIPTPGLYAVTFTVLRNGHTVASATRGL